MIAHRPLLIRATLALFLLLTQSQVIAHGFDHLSPDDKPVCATCVAGQTLTSADHGSCNFVLPPAQHFLQSCQPDPAFPAAVIVTGRARAPPPARRG